HQAGIRDPRRELDCVECYVPFSWYEPMWMENLHLAAKGEGWRMTEDGVTALDGELPVNMSGGVLSSNPIGASGMLRFLEAALQVRGLAGEHQVPGAKLALGQAYGGNAQYFAMWVVGARPDWQPCQPRGGGGPPPPPRPPPPPPPAPARAP